MKRSRGFTLIELIVALTVSAIVVGFMATFIAVPVQSWLAQQRRAELSDAAESAMRWIEQDVRNALPNSLRERSIGNRRILEMINVAAVAIYQDASGDPLDFTAPDNSFDVLGPHGGAFNYVVVNNRGTGAQNAYTLSNVIAPGATGAASDQVQLTPAFHFTGGPSPLRRAYLVTNVTRYECDLTTGALLRYTNLPITAAINLVAAPSEVIARDVTACQFQTSLGGAADGGWLRTELTVSRDADGNTERLVMMRQTQVANPP